MKSKILFLVILVSAFVRTGWAGIDEGIEYKLVSPPQPTISKNKVEVVELFWYGCPHCYYFEPDLKKWLKNKPKNVSFYRIPAVFNARWEIHAKAFYTAQALGVLDKIHEPLFDEIHKHKKHLHGVKDIKAFFIKQGVSAEDFNNTFSSFAVDAKVRRAKDLSKRYAIEGVPTLIVNGKYRTDGPMAGGRKGMLKVLDYLIKKESARK